MEQCTHREKERIIGTGYPDKYGYNRCKECGANLGWIKKPKNETKRTDNNHKWRSVLREKSGGNMRCLICGWEEKLDGTPFDVHHIVPISEGGPDELGNVRALCVRCHRIVHALRDESNRRRAEITK